MAHPNISAMPSAAAAPRLERSFAAQATNVATARRFVSGWLQGWIPDEHVLAGDIALAVSEACTNVVVHAYPDGVAGAFHVLAERDGDRVEVTVSDDGGGMVPRPDSPGLGLGLPVIAMVAESVQVRPAPHGSGTVVAMRFSRANGRARA